MGRGVGVRIIPTDESVGQHMDQCRIEFNRSITIGEQHETHHGSDHTGHRQTHYGNAAGDSLIMSNDLFNALAREPYEPRGIPNSEMAFIIFSCQRLGIKVILESGRARGQSTYLLAKYLPDTKIHSIEMRKDHPDEAIAVKRLEGFKNVRLHYGQGDKMLPKLARHTAPLPTAILCDGPKGVRAVGVLKSCFANKHVRVGFIHDMRKLDHGKTSIHRQVAVDTFPNHIFSDEDRFVTRSRWMDDPVVAASGPVGPEHEAVFGSYGPTVGAFFPS